MKTMIFIFFAVIACSGIAALLAFAWIVLAVLLSRPVKCRHGYFNCWSCQVANGRRAPHEN
jgi:predicted RND superfamily exporter protein